MSAAPRVASATEKRDKYPANHDCAAASAVTLADGTPAWLAAVADGCGGDDRGTRVARLAVERFSKAVSAASAADFSAPETVRAWCARWGNALQNEVVSSPLKGGNSTLVGAVLLDDRRTAGSWRLAVVNIGDSFAHLYRGPSLQRESAVPAAPADNPNTAETGGGLRRAVGLQFRPGYAVLDSDLLHLPAAGEPYLLVLASDGLDSYVRTIGAGPNKRLFPCSLMSLVAYLETLGAGLPFERLPQALLDRSLANARRCGFSGLDNSTVAMIGIGYEPAPLPAALARAQAIRARLPGSGVRSRPVPPPSPSAAATIPPPRKRRTAWIAAALAAAAVVAVVAGAALFFLRGSDDDVPPPPPPHRRAAYPADDMEELLTETYPKWIEGGDPQQFANALWSNDLQKLERKPRATMKAALQYIRERKIPDGTWRLDDADFKNVKSSSSPHETLLRLYGCNPPPTNRREVARKEVVSSASPTNRQETARTVVEPPASPTNRQETALMDATSSASPTNRQETARTDPMPSASSTNRQETAWTDPTSSASSTNRKEASLMDATSSASPTKAVEKSKHGKSPSGKADGKSVRLTKPKSSSEVLPPAAPETDRVPESARETLVEPNLPQDAEPKPSSSERASASAPEAMTESVSDPELVPVPTPAPEPGPVAKPASAREDVPVPVVESRPDESGSGESIEQEVDGSEYPDADMEELADNFRRWQKNRTNDKIDSLISGAGEIADNYRETLERAAAYFDSHEKPDPSFHGEEEAFNRTKGQLRLFYGNKHGNYQRYKKGLIVLNYVYDLGLPLSPVQNQPGRSGQKDTETAPPSD